MYKGDSYLVVSPFMTGEENDQHYIVAYDIEVLGSKGIERRHGFCSTRVLDRLGAYMIVQVG